MYIIYLQQFCTDTECSQQDLPEAMDDKRQMARERELGKSVLAAWHDNGIK